FGNVGSFAARFLHEAGARVIGVSDVSGGVWNPEGLDIPALIRWNADHKSVTGFPGTDAITNDELLRADVDLLIPAALGGVITKKGPRGGREKVGVEAANNPTRAEADKILMKRNVVVVPDILANAGGVTVSYFEWVQNRQHFNWDLARVRKELDRVMVDSFDRVWNIAQEKHVSLRTAAYIIGIGRVGRATVLGGI